MKRGFLRKVPSGDRKKTPSLRGELDMKNLLFFNCKTAINVMNDSCRIRSRSNMFAPSFEARIRKRIFSSLDSFRKETGGEEDSRIDSESDPFKITCTGAPKEVLSRAMRPKNEE